MSKSLEAALAATAELVTRELDRRLAAVPGPRGRAR